MAQAVANFNGRRYLHADAAWRRVMLSMPENERPFLEALRLVTWGLIYADGKKHQLARRELGAGLAQLRCFPPAHLGLDTAEVTDLGGRLLGQLLEGDVFHLIPPVIRRVRGGDLA